MTLAFVALLLGWRGACAGAAHAHRALAQSDEPFLSELPLEVLAVTPAGLLSDDDSDASRRIRGAQPIQVVFSRAVIALGADPSNVADAQRPFTVGDGSLGSYRWINSYVARFDPFGDWPSDAALSFTWNRELVSWDGLTLDNTSQLRVRCR